MSKAVFIGVDLQEDWVNPKGALPVPGAGPTLSAAQRLVRHALDRGLPLLLTQDSHEDDAPAFESFPAHCVDGTMGHALSASLGLGQTQRVPAAFAPELSFSSDRPAVIPVSDHRRGLFSNLNADRLLDAAFSGETSPREGGRARPSGEVVLFGLPLEIGVRAAATGLLARGYTCVLVSDAVAGLDPDRSASILASLAASGCHFLTAEKVAQRYA